MVREHRACGSQWAAITSIAEKFGCSPETLRKGLGLVEIDDCQRPGVTTAQQARIAELERENRQLREAKEILRKASAYLSQAERW